MHDKNGKEISNGDGVVMPWGFDGETVSGIVSHLYPGSETCNCQVSFISQYQGIVTTTCNASELEIIHRGKKGQ